MQTSDPALRAASRPRDAWWLPGTAGAAVERRVSALPERRPAWQRAVAFGLVAFAGLCVTLYGIATVVSSPLDSAGGAASTWSVEVASTGARPVTVLAYGRDVGLHIVRVPSEQSDNPARVIPARLADAELHLVSLGLSHLSVRASAPPGTTPMELSATSRTVTVFQNSTATGVRNGW